MRTLLVGFSVALVTVCVLAEGQKPLTDVQACRATNLTLQQQLDEATRAYHLAVARLDQALQSQNAAQREAAWKALEHDAGCVISRQTLACLATPGQP